MSFSGWLIAICIVILIIGLTFGIGWWNRNHTTLSPSATAFIPNSVWSKTLPSPNLDKNTCQIYTFPTQISPSGVGFPPQTIIPGVPTLDTATLNNMMGAENINTICVDSDQISAQQVQHTCISPNPGNPNLTLCRLTTGGITGLGGTEIFYTACPGVGLKQCAGQISSVSVNFQAPQNPNIYCIANNGPGLTVSMEPCDPSQSNQLFRVTRINPGQNPNSLTPGQGQNGLIAQILDRTSGLCLAPGDATITTTFDQSYLNPVGCSGSATMLVSGTNVITTDCTEGLYPGYGWMLLPSLPFCPNPDGCNGCTGCNGCERVVGTNICAGCNGCVGFETTVTPPQIVYVGDLDISNIPVTEYNQLTGSSALIQWLIDNGARSLYYGGTGNNLILKDLAIDISDCTQKPFTAQYMNLTSYNTLSQEEVCIQEGTFGTLNCPTF